VSRSDGMPTVASEAIRSGRPALGRSFRLHRPRGPICADGYCFQCEFELPAGRVLACRTASGPSARRVDPLRALGRVAERWPPWFWERRFLRPAAARRLYLEALRRLSSAPHLGGHPVATSSLAWRDEEVEVAVVGPEGNVGGIALGLYAGPILAVARPDALVALRFERLVVSEAGYPRLPPIRGNDLPGVLALSALERYGSAGGVPPGLRIAVWGDDEGQARCRSFAKAAGADVVWASALAPRALHGRGRLGAVEAEGRIPCDVFAIAVYQPAVELPFQAGAGAVLTAGEVPILVPDRLPHWLELAGSAAVRSSGVPDVPANDEAFACLCEDVRVRDIRRAVADGFDHPELVKRRTGALTGPCQGKLCAPLVLALLRDLGADHTPTRARPLARPVRLADLAAHA
jgi:bacterioferritin-associated ferredoxin